MHLQDYIQHEQENSSSEKIWISSKLDVIWCVTACDILKFLYGIQIFDGMIYLLFMFEMYYWGRLRKEGSNYKDKYNHSWTLVCQHTYPSQEVPSAGLLLYRAEHDCKRCQSSMTILLCFSITETAFWIAALLVFWLNYEFMFDNRWQSDLLRRGSCPWTDDTPPSLQLLCPATALWAAALCLASHPSV